MVIFLGVALIVVIELFLSGIGHWFEAIPYWPVFSLLIFLCFLGVLWALARKWKGELLPEVLVEDHPHQVKALVLFLSLPGNRQVQATNRERCEKADASLDNPVLRQSIEGPWRMPIEALAFHQQRLKTVIVIPSSDRKEEDPPRGTFRFMSDFKSIICLLSNGNPQFQIVTPAEFLNDNTYQNGIDFEDMGACLKLMNRIYQELRVQNFNSNDILVDITGGLKLNSIAGAAAAILIPNRKFQYVNMNTYTVRTYDMTLGIEG